jgi:predicted PurR-regulated permease PerM
MGRAVSLHPLAVVIGITAGGVLAGVIGALLVVPAIAFFNSFVRVLAAQDPDSEADSLDDEGGPLVDSNVDDPGPKR